MNVIGEIQVEERLRFPGEHEYRRIVRVRKISVVNDYYCVENVVSFLDRIIRLMYMYFNNHSRFDYNCGTLQVKNDFEVSFHRIYAIRQ